MDESMSQPSKKVKQSNIVEVDEDGSQHISVCFSGQPHNYTYLAAEKVFTSITKGSGTKIDDIIPCGAVNEVFQSINCCLATYGILPIESSSHGTIHNVYDKLLGYNGKIVIVGEIGILEQHCLCTLPNTDERDITAVVGHPHILECCSDYLDFLDSQLKLSNKPPLKRIASWDSAAGCEMVAQKLTSDDTLAAIGSKEAALFYGLKILKQGVGNDQNAETRYVVLARCVEGTSVADSNVFVFTPKIQAIDPLKLSTRSMYPGSDLSIPKDSDVGYSDSSSRKASIALSLRNIPGSIFKMASCFALRDIDIVKIESRPAAASVNALKIASGSRDDSRVELSTRAFSQKHWDLVFYVDFEPSSKDAVNRALLENLKEYSVWIRELGYYYSSLQRIDVKPTNWNEMLDLISIA